MIKRKLGLRNDLHPLAEFLRIHLRSERPSLRRIEAFFVRWQKENAIFAKTGRDKVEELSGFPAILFETRFDISDIFHAQK